MKSTHATQAGVGVGVGFGVGLSVNRINIYYTRMRLLRWNYDGVGGGVGDGVGAVVHNGHMHEHDCFTLQKLKNKFFNCQR